MVDKKRLAKLLTPELKILSQRNMFNVSKALATAAWSDAVTDAAAAGLFIAEGLALAFFFGRIVRIFRGVGGFGGGSSASTMR